MDDDGFTVQGRKRRGTTREPAREIGVQSFLREVPRYQGTSEDFQRSNTRRYRAEEGSGSDSDHGRGHSHFPYGSNRETLHKHYSSSTRPRDRARNAYHDRLRAANHEYGHMGVEERDYYREHTGGLPPHQHERLDPHARQLRDSSLRNANNRRAFLEAHPHGYHTARDQERHYDYAENAYAEYEYARDRQAHHEKHRSYSKSDKRVDQWGRPVRHR